jgi:hypothetical protein
MFELGIGYGGNVSVFCARLTLLVLVHIAPMRAVNNLCPTDRPLGVGRNVPDPRDMRTLPDGVQVPLGRCITNPDLGTAGGSSGSGVSLLYNEYIVYDTAQVCICIC